MFCTKCGFDAGNAKFCPKCGTALAVNPTPVQEAPTVEPVQTPVEPQMQAAPVVEPQTQAVPVQPMQFGQQPQQQAQPGFGQPQMQAAQPQFNSMPFGGQPGAPMPTPKKKKWPKVVAIVAVVAIILGVGGYFAYPYIADMISPKKQAVTALKNAGSDMESLVSDSIKSMSSTSVSSQQEIKGSFKVSSANIDGTNYMSYLKVDTVNYTVQTDATTGTSSGVIGLASGSGSNVINVQFYTDMNYLYFKIPELFTESFKVSLSDVMSATGTSTSISSSFGDLSSVSSMLGSFDASTLAQYSDVIEAVMKDCMTGFDKMVESCTYKKTGSSTYQSENGDIKVATFDVTLTKAALTDGINAAIDAIYSDKNLTSYVSLLSAGTGMTKETLKVSVQTGLSTMKDIPFTMYVNSDDKIVKVIFDVSTFSPTETGEILFEFIGKDKPTDYIVMQATVDDVTMKYTMKSSGNNTSMAFDIIPDQSVNNGEFMSFGFDLATSGNKVTLNNMYVKANVSSYVVDIAMSGDSTTSSFSTMTYSLSSFKNAIDPTYMTSTQETKLQTELMTNMPVLNKIIDDSLFSLMLKSTSSSSLPSTGTSSLFQ